MSAAFGPSRTGPMLINSCASPMAVRNHSKPISRGPVCKDSLNNQARHQFKRLGSVFSRSSVDANPIHWQPLFCPAYLKALQTGSFQNKWRERALWDLLGRSPVHACGTGSEPQNWSSFAAVSCSDGSILQHSERTRWQRPTTSIASCVVLRKQASPQLKRPIRPNQFVSLSDKGQEIEDKDDDQESSSGSYNDGSQRAANG
jgi:hypothetical protein